MDYHVFANGAASARGHGGGGGASSPSSSSSVESESIRSTLWGCPPTVGIIAILVADTTSSNTLGSSWADALAVPMTKTRSTQLSGVGRKFHQVSKDVLSVSQFSSLPWRQKFLSATLSPHPIPNSRSLTVVRKFRRTWRRQVRPPLDSHIYLPRSYYSRSYLLVVCIYLRNFIRTQTSTRSFLPCMHSRMRAELKRKSKN